MSASAQNPAVPARSLAAHTALSTAPYSGEFMRDRARWLHMRGGNGRAESSDPASDTRAGQPSSSEDGTLLVDIETRQVTGFLPDIAQSPGAAGYDEGWNGGVVGNIDRRQVSLGQAWVQIEALALANRRKNEFL